MLPTYSMHLSATTLLESVQKINYNVREPENWWKSTTYISLSGIVRDPVLSQCASINLEIASVSTATSLSQSIAGSGVNGVSLCHTVEWHLLKWTAKFGTRTEVCCHLLRASHAPPRNGSVCVPASFSARTPIRCAVACRLGERMRMRRWLASRMAAATRWSRRHWCYGCG